MVAPTINGYAPTIKALPCISTPLTFFSFVRSSRGRALRKDIYIGCNSCCRKDISIIYLYYLYYISILSLLYWGQILRKRGKNFRKRSKNLRYLGKDLRLLWKDFRYLGKILRLSFYQKVQFRVDFLRFVSITCRAGACLPPQNAPYIYRDYL